jgi:hypothetical protein
MQKGVHELELTLCSYLLQETHKSYTYLASCYLIMLVIYKFVGKLYHKEHIIKRLFH